MKLIDKDAVVAEINKLTRKNELYLDENASDAVRFSKTGAYSVLCDLRHFLDTIEVKEVDLEKEIDSQWKDCAPVDEGMGSEFANIGIEQFANIAKHFFELGLRMGKKDGK